MKNIFRIMAAALVASTMLFVACGKEEEEDPINDTPAVQADGTVITQFQIIGDQTVYTDTLPYVDAYRIKDVDTEYCITNAMVWLDTAKGELTLPFVRQSWKICGTDENADVFLWDIKYSRSYNNAKQVSDSLRSHGMTDYCYFDNFYPEWYLYDFHYKITGKDTNITDLVVSNFDATTFSFDYGLGLVMGSYIDVLNGKTKETLTKADLKVVAKKISFKELPPSKGVKTKDVMLKGVGVRAIKK